LHKFCPLNIVTLGSILITVALFVWAGVNNDAVALIGLATMSLSTSTACLSSQWRPKLTVRKSTAAVIPRGDIIIRSRNGAFVFVECDENVAREIYFGTEACDYVYKGVVHQILLATSTLLLMASIILFSNSGWKMQIAVGLAYVILNIAYWAMALLTEPRDMILRGLKSRSLRTTLLAPCGKQFGQQRRLSGSRGLKWLQGRRTGRGGWMTRKGTVRIRTGMLRRRVMSG
jgi:hypothetical protein